MTDAQQGRWAVAAMFLANGFIMGAWAPQIPLLLPRHGIGEAMLGLLILVLGLGAVAAMLFAGRLIQRHGARRVLCGFAFAVIPVLPLVVIAPNLPLLALAMALFGALIGCMDVAMNANAVEVERGMRRAIMSSSHGFWSLGGFLGGSLGGLALAQWGAGDPAALQCVLAPVDRGRNVERQKQREAAFGGGGRSGEDRKEPYQCPELAMLAHGSSGVFAAPRCKSSTEMLSGDRTKAMCPSRGGRLIVTPCAIRYAQVAWMSSTS